ncbi:ROK family glucokinase [Nocardioides coralli]|uniref:ROK family glucokinase n=1 Tax=Nocardioides coralli TaxID=2872154 RepID=UPI001CA45744|nr:ROK family glucokinase [Nocardioides coralli]QZY28005.1 ROK family glucokinase [Nocardioides coralli]
MSLTCGIDVGGTKIAGGVVDEEGRVLERLRVESPASDVAAIEDAISDLVSQLRSRHDVEAVGVGAAGYVDRDRAKVLIAPNLAWRDVDLKGELEDRIGLRVVVENDANAAAWGEFRYGAGHDVEDLLLVTVGTGVGGGLVLGGDVHRGAFGVAAEIGHLRVVPGGHPCGCGQRGCLEQYASGSALVRDARRLAGMGEPAAAGLVDRAGAPGAITGPDITAAAQAGDPFAVERLAETGRWLGEGIASLCSVLDPAVVAIGGGVSEAQELLLEPLRVAFEASLPGRAHRPVAAIRLATLGNSAGLVGAADLARR